MPTLRTVKDFAIVLTNIPAGKAYLQRMLQEGMVPAKILYLDLDTRKPTDTLALRLFKNLPVRWQMRFFSPWMSLIESPDLGFDPYEDILVTLRRHQISFETVRGKSVNDPLVVERIRALRETYLLYTAGGIVREPLFSLGKRWIHIHPGYLPHIRGGHGVLWSLLGRDRCGATCFFMNPGIDTGEIISKQEFAPPRIRFRFFTRWGASWHLTLLDWALQFSYDPYLRAEVLMDVLKRYQATGTFEATPQVSSEGETYHVMHPLLAAHAIERCRVGAAEKWAVPAKSLRSQ